MLFWQTSKQDSEGKRGAVSVQCSPGLFALGLVTLGFCFGWLAGSSIASVASVFQASSQQPCDCEALQGTANLVPPPPCPATAMPADLDSKAKHLVQAASELPGKATQTTHPAEYWAKIAELVAQVREQAHSSVRDRCIRIIEGRPGFLNNSWSQAGQDWVLFHNYFWRVPYGQGKYIDAGSSGAQHMSNTFFLDRCLGWKGVCIEPNERYHALYTEGKRTCKLVKNCVAATSQVVSMNFSRGTSAELLPAGQGSPVQCRPLADVVEEFGLEHAEFASLDIEGGEISALKCFPFRKYGIQTWAVDTKRSDPRLTRIFLRGGYTLVSEILDYSPHYPSATTRVGRGLDSIFRIVSPPLVLGPEFLPGRRLHNQGPRPACASSATRGSAECPEQLINFHEDEVNKSSMTLLHGACGVHSSVTTMPGVPDHVLPSAIEPAAALKESQS